MLGVNDGTEGSKSETFLHGRHTTSILIWVRAFEEAFRNVTSSICDLDLLYLFYKFTRDESLEIQSDMDSPFKLVVQRESLH